MNDNKLTVWQSIEVLTNTILNMQKELSLIKNTSLDQDVTLEKGRVTLPRKSRQKVKTFLL
ncbi:hypothetical protein [Wolbachia endosymbiont (group B) of Villa cingulata]|uniref:hypothetical protein n=1 Tax=Wolbachia endosymbiont (group B) of Villa cingulata TaxID=3066157 RepID=UPI0033400080